MDSNESSGLPGLIRKHRIKLWILLLPISGLILLFPSEVQYEYSAIQSASVFGENLPLFIFLYAVWICIGGLLLFGGGATNEWQRVALLAIIAIVFLNFWTVITPNGGYIDELWNLGHVNYIEETGSLMAGHHNLIYFQFPGFHIDIFALSQITDMDPIITRTVFMIFSSIVLTVLFYLLFKKVLRSPVLASLAILLMFQGSLFAKSQVFWPGILAFIFLIVILLLTLRHDNEKALGSRTTSGAFVLLIIFAGFTISYIPTALYAIFILGGIYLLQWIAKKPTLRLSTIILLVTMVMAWEIYWAVGVFSDLIGLAVFPNLLEKLPFFGGIASGYVGESIPAWAQFTRYFWLALIFGFGIFLGFHNLLRIRRLSSMETILTGGLMGTITVTGIIYVAVVEAQWTRFMTIAPIFTIPILLWFFSGLGKRGKNQNGNVRSGWWQRHAIAIMAVVTLSLSLPSFLMHETSFTTNAVYSYELATGEFLQSAYGNGEELALFSSASGYTYSYYMSEVHFTTTAAPEKYLPEDEFWPEIEKLLEGFEQSNTENSVFVLTDRFRRAAGHPMEIEETDPQWLIFIERLEKQNKVYDNGSAHIYQRASG